MCIRDRFYGLTKFVKNFLPKRLFYRALLIVAVPVILLQLLVTIVFFDSLWIKTNKGMTRALVGEIDTFIVAFDNENNDKDYIIDLFSIYLDLNIKYIQDTTNISIGDKVYLQNSEEAEFFLKPIAEVSKIEKKKGFLKKVDQKNSDKVSFIQNQGQDR